MSILYIDLENNEVKALRDKTESGYLLLHELMDGKSDRIAFTSILADDLEFRGASSTCHAFYSPLKDKIVYGYSNSLFGFVLYSFGYTALVLSGRADRLSYISVRGDSISVRECESLKLSSFSTFKDAVKQKESDIVLATGCAADRGIKCSALYEDGFEIGRGGFGHAFASLNLKGLVFQSYLPKRKESDEGRKYLRELERSSFARIMKRESDTFWLNNAERNAMLPFADFSRRHDARTLFLDGSYLKGEYGAYSSSCTDCPVSCKRVLQDGSDSPTFSQMAALGTMQDIFSSERVMLLTNAVTEAGIECVEAGAILAEGNLSFEDKLRACGKYDGREYGKYKIGGISPLLDIRGSGEAALFLILGDTALPYYSMYAPRKITDERVCAILAVFERIYRFSLSSRGLPVKGAYAAYVASMPSFFYSHPLLVRGYLEHVSFFDLDASLLIREGLEIINMIGEEENTVDEHFIYTSSSDNEKSTVNPTRLIGFYKREKRRLELKYLNRLKKRKGEKR